MGKRQHDPDKERVFVRPITGAYSLTEVADNLRGVLPQDTTGNLNPEDWYFVK